MDCDKFSQIIEDVRCMIKEDMHEIESAARAHEPASIKNGHANAFYHSHSANKDQKCSGRSRHSNGVKQKQTIQKSEQLKMSVSAVPFSRHEELMSHKTILTLCVFRVYRFPGHLRSESD